MSIRNIVHFIICCIMVFAVSLVRCIYRMMQKFRNLFVEKSFNFQLRKFVINFQWPRNIALVSETQTHTIYEVSGHRNYLNVYLVSLLGGILKLFFYVAWTRSFQGSRNLHVRNVVCPKLLLGKFIGRFANKFSL